MTPTEYLEENNNELKLKLEKNLLRNKVTKEMMDFAKEYHTQQLILSGVSKCFSYDQMIEASRYGYNYRDTTSFPNKNFDDNCKNNTRQWLTTLK